MIVLLIGLFAVVFTQNMKRRDESLASASSRAEVVSNLFVRQMRESLLGQENDMVLSHHRERVPVSPVFVREGERFTPAALLPYTRSSVSKRDAAAAFDKGVRQLPNSSAANLFEVAAMGPAGTAEESYQKISALFNLMEFRDDSTLACSIIFLLDEGELSTPRAKFFNSMLAERVEDLPRVRSELAKRRAEAEEISQLELVQPSPFRRMVGDKMLSVLKDNHAVYHPLDWNNMPFGEWSPKHVPGSFMLCPGLFSLLDKEAIAYRKREIKKQYNAGNTVLMAMLSLALFLIAGIIAAARRQRKLETARTRFIATVSHELRTPLSLIRLHAETLAHGRVPAGKEHEYHQTILTEAERLTGIVNNVLDFSRMERDKLQVHLEPTNLSELTARGADSFRDRLRQDDIALERKIAKGVSGLVDPLAYSQILFNLLDNAIKYSDGAKSIRIELDVRDGWNILSVADQGLGVPEKLKPRIFDEFTRSDDRKVTARRGSGIGLNVAKRLTEKMDGTIAVADNEPKGSIFTVSLKVMME